MAPQLGWIGLGNMGRGMCKNLVQKGSLSTPLLVYNRTTSRAETLTKDIGHSTVSPSIADVVSKSDIIFICLGDDKAVQEAIDTAIQSGNVKGKLLVDCSTIHPDTTSVISKAVEAQGAAFVACPVFGAPAAADAGMLVCVLAGPKTELEKVKPYCKGVMGRAEIEFPDEPPSKASLLKLIGNTFLASIVGALAEGHVVAEKSGLGTDTLHKFIETMFPGSPYAGYSNRLLSGDYYKRDPLFQVDIARKDCGHAMALAERAGSSFEGVKVVDRYLKVVKEHMGDRGDIAGIYGAKRVEAGLKFENQD